MVKKDDGQLTGDEKIIREKFLLYFRNLYRPSTGSPNSNNIPNSSNGGGSTARTCHRIFEDLNRNSWPKIPDSAHRRIIAVPDYYEIKKALFDMGPDKIPGPDGSTARFFQHNWHVVGQEIVQQIKMVFVQEEIPDDWLRCHVTLIPKTDEPQTPAEYRPISIGNILYRLIMKLIARRLQPSLKQVISNEQNAFVKGRCISDNILFVKEILHSFSLSSFKQQAFMLKADVNKAFDKLEWSFLQMAMEYLNIPTKIITLIVSSYCRARVTININGKGNEFINPTRGLRQGCPMSPYVFIIAMEVLSRMIKGAISGEMLRGIQVAHTSPVVTHAIYADDLILMGDAREVEVQLLYSLLQTFANASGLHINPYKSKLWFSRNCNQQIVNRIKEMWGVEDVNGEEKYLGVMLNEKGDIRSNGKLLLEKLKAKLSGWKSHMLSHAGRLVLIKSVLMSMPVYTMSLEMIPKRITKEMNSVMAKFFWGKIGQDRYLSMIGWKKVCKPFDCGGLGVKDMQKFGEALFLKVVWSLMADDDKIWVKICKSKYYPTIDYWGVKNSNACSRMWRQVLKMRNFFTGQVNWQIANGRTVQDLSQPWYNHWSVQQVAKQSDRRLTVRGLIEEQTGQWNMQLLTRLFTPSQIQQIVTTDKRPDVLVEESDRLIWQQTKDGKYSVREGYKVLTREQNDLVDTQAIDWQLIWKQRKLTPKVKIFLWRLLHKGLPMAANLHRRINNFTPTCQRCNQENEYEMHCLFFCELSRQVWFAGAMGIRVHELPLDIVQTVTQILGQLDDDGVELFANTMWEIWKERNKVVIEHSIFRPQEVIQRVKVGVSTGLMLIQPQRSLIEETSMEKYEFQNEGWQVLVDASWDIGTKSGRAYVVFDKGKLHSAG
ncbi:RNA-directed DNA polymerase (reverse transcriptase)-related family protein [Rhynchospora pubera]|uniref:RNA-directed DNA polymerase (Reverse transcriptase)-related family protein n=1 Tax=Rhynchospora pubera TaxID=906938 RepID=A0AAV8C5U7_9POAL|nr:RNA-directed DNA polymerase (reverse transcriptase)-related family protein [Rhynchospora pubera]